MIDKAMESFEVWTKPGKAAFDFWVSFWPVAPAFGVEWRFADTMPRFTPRILETPGEGETAAPAAKKAKPAAKKPAKIKAEPAVEIVEAVEEAVEAAVAPVEAMVEAVEHAMEPAPVADAAPVEDAVPGKPDGLHAKAPKTVDDLKLIKGIGPGLEKQLNGLGVYTFKQIAGFSDTDLAWIDDNLTAFKGRCFRDDWVGQAKAHLG
jgi:predicted flap endonuclease-1-like 5' DNA nuclease